MRKQTKLVAVLSTAALLALGASMSSFAAVGWAEENGTWVYYDKGGDAVTETWAKSGENWFYLDDNGEMATDSIIEYRDNYYYVDVNGAMVANTWVSVENEDYDGEDEPATIWYYFGTNGKAYTGSDDKASFKTINGKKYTFDSEGRMQFGWIGDDGKRNNADDAWETADYYCGDENDGAQAIGWRFLEIVDDNFEASDVVPNFSSKNIFDDEDQTRWFYFKANGKKEKNENGVTINGAKYSFDTTGRMNAEWVTASPSTPAAGATASDWRYFNSPEDGARVTKGWFKVVADERLNQKDYDDDSEAWYYADGKGALYANKIKEISGKRYAFDEYGRMKAGLRLIKLGNSSSEIDTIKGSDVDNREIDNEDDFLKNINGWLADGYRVYYFGSGDDGSMKTGKQNIDLDGDKFAFNFGKSGAVRGAGKNDVDSKKIYQGGMLLKAGKDEKYQVVKVTKNGIALPENKYEDKYELLTAEKFLDEDYVHEVTDQAVLDANKERVAHIVDVETAKENNIEYKLVNTSGTIQSGKSTAKDGDDNTFKQVKEDIVRVFEKE